MSPPAQTQLWFFSGRSSVTRLHKQLQSITDLHTSENSLQQIHFLDSVDWRLYRQGWALYLTRQDNRWLLKLFEITTGKMLALSPVDTIPGFVTDIPAGILSKYIYKVLYPRALITVCELRLRRREYACLNEEGKHYLRLFLDQPQAYLSAQAEARKLPNCLVVEPVTGYEKEANRFIKKLINQFDLQNKGTSLLLPCLAALKIETTYKDSKDRILLNPDESACLAISRIFSSFLDTMSANEAGLIKRIDTEFLHDFRIAVRRTRSLLGQVKNVFPEEKRQGFKENYAWLSTLTGPARDYDVMLLEFSKYRVMLNSDDNSEFSSLKEFLIAKQNQAYDRLIEALKSERYAALNKQWREFLASDFCQTCEIETKQAIQPFANMRIAHVFSRAISEGRSITPTSPVEEFHQLRKTCKKLRYLMETFRDLYSKKKVKLLINELKSLQDILGELQDLEVHMEILQEFLTQQSPKVVAKQESENLIQQLIGIMSKRKLALQDSFQARFNSFASSKNRKLFNNLFGSKSI